MNNLPPEYIIRFMPDKRGIRRSLRLSSLLFTAFGLLVGGMLLGFSITRHLNQTGDQFTIPGIIGAVFIIFWVLISLAASTVTTADITISGGQVIISLTRWLTVTFPVETLNAASMKTYRLPLTYRSLEKHETLYIFTMPKTAIIHQLAALYYGFGLRGMFLITPDHTGYEDFTALFMPALPLAEPPEELTLSDEPETGGSS